MSYVFPSQEDKKVEQRAGELRNLVADLKKWATGSSLPPREKALFMRRLVEKDRPLESIQEVASHPMTIGIFGESQTGKSYLVAELARGKAAKLMVQMGAQGEKNFLTEINPIGGTESTAQVTRFTCIPRPIDPDYPVEIKLLTPLDMLKLCINGFAYECKTNIELDEDRFLELMEEIRNSPDAPTYVFNEYDTYDLESYIANQLSDKEGAYFRSIENLNYWSFFREVVCGKSLEVKFTYISWLLGGVKSLNENLQRYVKAAINLNSKSVKVTSEAFLPRDTSIIDAGNFRKGLRTDSGTVSIKTPSGQTANISKTALSMLAAEVVFQLPQGDPDNFMQFCDVLDFPGARVMGGSYTAPDLDQPATADNQTDLLAEVLLRGKISYLFHKYNEIRDVNSLVLCMASFGNPSANSLPFLAQKWIARTHGPNARERTQKPTTLFTVFTKFDVPLTKKGGAPDPSSPKRWEAILKNNFEDFFAKVGKGTENWTQRWDDYGAFRNCFWIRNPNVPSAVFSSEEGVHGETVTPDHREWLPQLGSSHNFDPLVNSHFADSRKAWEEVATPNHNGIDYLANSISAGLHPTQKSGMLRRDLAQLQGDIQTIAARWIVDDQAATKAIEEAEQRITELRDIEKEGAVFGFILDRMWVRDSEICSLYDDAYKGRRRERPGLQLVTPDEPKRRPGRPGRNHNFKEAPPKRAEAEPAQVECSPEAARFAQLVIEKWEDRLSSMETDDALLNISCLSPDWFRSVMDNVVKAAHSGQRNGENSPDALTESLPDMIARTAKPSFLRPDVGSGKKTQAFLASQIVGKFVSELGYGPINNPNPINGAPKPTGHFPGRVFLEEWLERLKKVYNANSGVLSEETIQDSAALRRILEKYTELK